MHLSMAASLCGVICADACNAKQATQSAIGVARRNLFMMLMIHLPYVLYGTIPSCEYYSQGQRCGSCSPLRIRRVDVIFCRHPRMAFVPALGVAPIGRKRVGPGVILELGVCPSVRV